MTTLKPVKVFTHTDLDGVGSGIIFQAMYNKDNVAVTYCDYQNVNERINKFLENEKPTDYATIFITDISVDLETAEKLDLIHRGGVARVVLLDHHDTAKWLNEYEWAVVESIISENPLRKTSGTSLIVDWFDNEGGYDVSEGVRLFAEVVRKYDTWEWTTVYNEILPKELNDYLYMVGRGDFVNLMLATIPSNEKGKEVYFDVKARALLDQKQKEIKAYIEKKDKQMIARTTTHNDTEFTFGLVFAEQYISELGNELCKMHPEIAFVIMVEMGTRKISLRTVRDDIHLGELAKEIGGGGHPKAAGAQFGEQKIIDFLGDLF